MVGDKNSFVIDVRSSAAGGREMLERGLFPEPPPELRGYFARQRAV
jgi:hypothetical protein